jgi:penicillin-insensitive murein endopeptidase
MGRLFGLLWLSFLFISCAKSPGFKASDYNYTRVEASPQKENKMVYKPGSVVRTSNKISFVPLSSDEKWDPQNVNLKANVKFGDKTLGDVEFKGRKKDSKILLEPVDPELKDNLKAMMICTSEGDGCDEFFIDVFYRDNEVIYHDQFPAQKKVVASKDSKNDSSQPKAPTKSTSPSPTTPEKMPAQPVTPAPAKSPTANSSPSPVKSGQPPVKITPPQKPIAPGAKDPKSMIQDLIRDTTVGPEEIPDGVTEEEEEKSGYVGTPEEEVQKIFNIPLPKSPNLEPSPQKEEEKVPNQQPQSPQQPEKQQLPAKQQQALPPKQPTKDPAQKTPPDQTAPPQAQQLSANKSGSADPLERFRVKNQVIGSPSKGRLQNATDFLKLSGLPGLYFFIAKPSDKDYFGAFDMAVVLKKIGEALQTFMPGRKLAITSISKWGGGYLAPHKGHQNGTDADVRYLTDDVNAAGSVVFKGTVISKFLAANQWKLLKKTFQTNMVDVVFVDPAVKRAMCEEARRVHDYQNGVSDSPGAEMLKRIQTWPKHDTHFHIRIRCSSDNPSCKQINMSFDDVGC